MRAPLLVGLLTVALTATACSASTTPAPTVLGDGMITEITSPAAGLEYADLLALGPSGEALIEYRIPSEDQDGSNGRGLALVHRDGSFDVISLNASQLEVDRSFVSETSVAWVGRSSTSDERSLWFWDRGTHRLSESSITTTDGGSITLTDPFADVHADAVLVGNTVFWLNLTHSGAVISASSSDGRSSLPLGSNNNWVNLGIDECASTPARPMLWGVRVLDTSWSTFESVQIDVTDPHAATVIEGSGIPISNSAYSSLGPSSRCGNDLLIEDDDVDTELRILHGTSMLDKSGESSILVTLPRGAAVESLVLTPEWIGVTYFTYDFGATAGNPSRPGQLSFALPALHDEISPQRVSWLVHRDSGKVDAFEPSWDTRYEVCINGDFIAWNGPDGRGPYVGILTPPTG